MEQLSKSLTNGGLTMFFIFLLLLLVAFWYLSEQKGLPPGPHGLPIVGYLPFMGKKAHETFAKLGEKYGPVFRVYFGTRLVVVLNDYTSIKEAFIKQAETFSGRPKIMFSSIDSKYNTGILTVDGEFFKDHRRFTLTFLRDCGVGKLSIEPRILEEIYHFLLKLKAFNGRAADIKSLLTTSMANNICIMALGKQFAYDDPTFLQLQNYMKELNPMMNTVSAINFFPWLKHIPGALHLFKQEKIKQIYVKFHKFLHGIVMEHKQNYTNGQRDHYVNAYITEQQSRLKKTKNVGNFDDDTLQNNMDLLIGAGTNTTTNTILWGILYLMRHPNIQKKVQDELHNVVGSDRAPSWNDRLRTPYTEATICEIQRKADIVPINIPHRNLEECKVLGYTIPKDTFIVSNLGHVLADPKLWGDPENFRPERFLSKSGEVQKPEYFIPFSIGKRECLGENLARMELYLYLASMLQHFTFKTPEGITPSLESIYGITQHPQMFLTCAIARDK